MASLCEAEDRKYWDLLATDFAPTRAQANPLQRSIEADEGSIRVIDSQISSLELQLEQLRTRRLAFVKSSSVKEALLAPMRKLAPEILGEVFKWCIHIPTDMDDSRGSITPDSAPLLLVQVCRRWRRVTLGTPELWNTLALLGNVKMNPRHIILMWLQNSRSVPINIFLDTRPLSRTETNNLIRDNVFQYIADNINRCRVFRYTGVPGLLSQIFPAGQCAIAHLMHDLCIRDTSKDPPSQVSFGRVISPNLRFLHIDNIRILRNFIGTDTRSFPHLRHLSLQWGGGDDIVSLLGTLQTPVLDSLTLVEMRGNLTPMLGSALRSFLSASAPPLKELCIVRIKLPNIDLVSILATLPSLESLYFLAVHLDAAFFAALTPEPMAHPSTWILPRLSSLRLTVVNGVASELVRMVESRVSNQLRHALRHADTSDVGFKRLTHLEVTCCGLRRIHQTALKHLADKFIGFHIEGLEDF